MWTKNIKMLEQRLILVVWRMWMDLPCGHLGDAPGMGSVRNRAAASHTGAVCGVAYTPVMNLRTGVLSDTDNASSPLHSSTRDLTQEAKNQKKPKEKICVRVREMSSNIYGRTLKLSLAWGFCNMIGSELSRREGEPGQVTLRGGLPSLR